MSQAIRSDDDSFKNEASACLYIWTPESLTHMMNLKMSNHSVMEHCCCSEMRDYFDLIFVFKYFS